MTVLQSIILGLVQGLTEFLPVSSSGHLLLTSQAMGVTPSLSLELAYHVATLAAVCVYYRKTLFALIRKPFQPLTAKLFVSTLITAAIAFFMRPIAESMQDGRLLPLFFTLTAVLLVLSDKFHLKKPDGRLTCVVVGIAQGFAVIPGLSRSGATVSAAVFTGESRKSAVDYSFLLSLPIIAGSAVVELISSPLDNLSPLSLAAGLIAAFFSGLTALFVMTRLSKKLPSSLFAAYLIALSALILGLRCA